MHIIKAPRDEELRTVLAQENANGILIPDQIGVQLQIFLCGICIAVAFVSPAFAASGRSVRALLISVIILNIMYTACSVTILTAISSSQARDAASFNATETLAELLVMYFYLALATTVQIFYAIRVSKTLRAKHIKLSWLAAFAAGLCVSLVGWVGHIQMQTARYRGVRHDVDGPKRGVLATYGSVLHFVASAFVDILISATLAVSLLQKTEGFNARTDMVLQKLSRVTLATGALTSVTASVAAILNLTSYAVFESSKATMFSWTLPSLYSLSLFWTLDLRSRIRQEQGGRHVEIPLNQPLSLQSPLTTGGGRSHSRLEWLEMPYFGDPFRVCLPPDGH